MAAAKDLKEPLNQLTNQMTTQIMKSVANVNSSSGTKRGGGEALLMVSDIGRGPAS